MRDAWRMQATFQDCLSRWKASAQQDAQALAWMSGFCCLTQAPEPVSKAGETSMSRLPAKTVQVLL